MQALIDLLSSQIVQLVVAGAAMLGAISGMLGAFAVLRRQSLLSDALSHAALPGVCLAFLITGSRDMGGLLSGAFVTGVLAALTMMVIVRRTTLKTDAALGVVLSVFFAVGIVVLTYIQSQAGTSSAGLQGFLFGQAAAITGDDLRIMGAVGLAALVMVLALWKELKLVSFDPEFARSQGFPVLVLEALLTVIVTLAVVIGLQLVGVVLMVSLLIAPAAAARQWTHSLGSMLLVSGLIGALCGAGGALVSVSARGLATGPVIVLIVTAVVVVSLLFAPGRGVIWQRQALRRAQQEGRG